ncbi:MAG: hypothetical protein ACREQK_19960 [Candidatus Binatia bacterium]
MMAAGPDNPDWKSLNVAVTEKGSGKVLEYKMHFYRKTNGWYDEVRYDSHEIKKGRKTFAPHMHLKVATPFKDSVAGEEELKRIIDLILPQIKEITR